MKVDACTEAALRGAVVKKLPCVVSGWNLMMYFPLDKRGVAWHKTR
jgi:hypothetical protein